MFGLTIEKLFLVALLAAVIIGPRRLPGVAAKLSALLGQATRIAREAARRIEDETGASTIREDWRALDPRRYDPRRIIREAWDADARDAGEHDADEQAEGRRSESGAPAEPDAREEPSPPAPPRPAGAWVVQGSSGHPRRVWVAAED
ncbi:Sec-independent protein translocase TatB [Microbacterium sp. LMB2-1.2]|uniref:Sec-independent protein translocase subunit TatA/TatB n=1 Tax=Microbacterium sp. LMB2-1.2 TaxID=3135239 RepID=UPI003418D64E